MAVQLDEETFIEACIASGLVDPLINYLAEKHVASKSDYELRATPLISIEELKMRDKKKFIEEHSYKKVHETLGKAINFLNENPRTRPLAKKIIENPLQHKAQKRELHLNKDDLMHLMDIDADMMHEGFRFALRTLEKGYTDEALLIYQLLLTLQPSNAQGWIEKGLCHFAKEEWLDAEKAFDFASTLAPEEPLPLIHLIEASIAQQDKDKAKKYFEQCKLLVAEDETKKNQWRQRIVELKNIIQKQLR